MVVTIHHIRHNQRRSSSNHLNLGIDSALKKKESDSHSESYTSALEILSFSPKSGLPVADLEKLSIGFVIDFCLTKQSLLNGKPDEDEDKYYKLKDVLPFVIENYENGEISEEEYKGFIEKYQSLEDYYGWEYD